MDAILRKIEAEMENILDAEAESDAESPSPTSNSLLSEVYNTLVKDQQTTARRKLALEAGAVVAKLMVANPRVRTSRVLDHIKDALKNDQLEDYNQYVVDIDHLMNQDVAEDYLTELRDQAEAARQEQEAAQQLQPAPAPPVQGWDAFQARVNPGAFRNRYAFEAVANMVRP